MLKKKKIERNDNQSAHNHFRLFLAYPTPGPHSKPITSMDHGYGCIYQDISQVPGFEQMAGSEIIFDTGGRVKIACSGTNEYINTEMQRNKSRSRQNVWTKLLDYACYWLNCIIQLCCTLAECYDADLFLNERSRERCTTTQKKKIKKEPLSVNQLPTKISD